MTLNQMRAFTVIRQADLETTDGVDAFVSAAQILFPEREREAILNTPIDGLMIEIKARTEELATETNEAMLSVQGSDALENAKKILGIE